MKGPSLLLAHVGLLSMGLSAACSQQRATPAECRQIFARLVEIEVRELGFVDPVLIERHQQELAQRHATEVRQCVGRRLPDDALDCVEHARSSEEVSHVCLTAPRL